MLDRRGQTCTIISWRSQKRGKQNNNVHFLNSSLVLNLFKCFIHKCEFGGSKNTSVTCVDMLRSFTVSLMFSWRVQLLPSMHCSSVRQPENTSAVDALYNLSVNISKIRKLNGWVLYQNPVYVTETVTMLRTLGAKDPLIAQVLEHHPEAILCPPEHLEAQKELWMSICASHSDLVGIIEKFPASFFTPPCNIDHQKANIVLFQNLGLNKRVIAKLMASDPQNFRRPAEQNKEMVHALQNAYLDLGGNETNMKVWLQKLLIQNPYVLMKPPETMGNNLKFLQEQGFTSSELLQLLSKLKGFVTELHPESVGLTLCYLQEMLSCSDAELRRGRAAVPRIAVLLCTHFDRQIQMPT
ncbi:hypothetical protein AMELA_G00039490 [Ameiurus melas]|uniref:Uncharacterized protein n=1 Tax=Ameiurus melas TaxID=219545 RepID=A0A7J6BB35_AMEME|nr:hypothetical protein AMELA_G00039490 [Ameiurus melas]